MLELAVIDVVVMTWPASAERCLSVVFTVLSALSEELAATVSRPVS